MSKAISRTKPGKSVRKKPRVYRPVPKQGSASVREPGPPMLFDPMLCDEERHHEALERLSVRALSDGDYAAAFKLADRRCRIFPPAEPHHYMLRGDASYHLGDRDAAISDIVRALKIAPDNLLANRRMLVWGAPSQQIEAARSLFRHERDLGVLESAIVRLHEAGDRSFARVECTDWTVTGWAAWRGRSKLRIAITVGEAGAAPAIATIASDPLHPLRHVLGNAASIALDRPRSHQPQLIALYAGTKLIHEATARPNEDVSKPALPPSISYTSTRPPNAAAGSDNREARVLHQSETVGSTVPARSSAITIIVPVYEDYEATRACLESLTSELNSLPKARAILVDDASPNPQIRDYLDGLAKKQHIRLMRNARNLGFVHSVNRALEEVGSGDVLLLNADTILPHGCIARLHSAAHSAPKIGTLTPFSNNGEIMSFPIANKPNALPAATEIAALDAAAAAANADRVVDIPNGIGFCLYVTRDCLDQVGPLCDIYHRGYFEDVDFCLRARERGFRNVCASSIYVGHAGSRSFGGERQCLVMQNLAVLEERFPKYRPECAAYLLADPLRPSRASIERALPPSSKAGTLLVTGGGALKAVADRRAEELLRQNVRSLVAETEPLPAGLSVHIFDPPKGIPQSLTFTLNPAEQGALAAYLRRMQPSRIEIVDPAHVPPALLDLLESLEAPIDLLIADAGLVCRRGSLLRNDGSPCNALASGTACPDCVDERPWDPDAWPDSSERRERRWREVAARADRILAPCARAKDFAQHLLVQRPVTELAEPGRAASSAAPASPAGEQSGLGMIAVGDSATELRTVTEIAQALRKCHPDLSITVIGKTQHDIALMRIGNVFVTGAVEPEERQRVVHQYRLKALFTTTRRPLFGHPAITDLAGSGLPIAFYDWSFGRVPARSSDRPLNPYAASDAVAAELVTWLTHL